jgi:hypothetical protein
LVTTNRTVSPEETATLAGSNFSESSASIITVRTPDCAGPDSPVPSFPAHAAASSNIAAAMAWTSGLFLDKA